MGLLGSGDEDAAELGTNGWTPGWGCVAHPPAAESGSVVSGPRIVVLGYWEAGDR